MQLTGARLQRTRRALLGELGDEIIDLMFDMQFGHSINGLSPRVRREVEELGWIDVETGKFTGLGWFAADSCREYRFWADRGRRLPFEGAAGHLTAAHFSGKSILEIGCGVGANLMTLDTVADDLVGVEPVEVYRQLGAIFSERENRSKLDIRAGTGEAIPAGDDRFDVVLCVSSFQYLDGTDALREITRVLKPGGELLVIGGTIGTYVREGLKPVLRGSAHGLKAYGMTILNTLSYMSAGRRLIVPRGEWSTASPVYPTRRFTCRQIERTGLELLHPLLELPPETCFRARKSVP